MSTAYDSEAFDILKGERASYYIFDEFPGYCNTVMFERID